MLSFWFNLPSDGLPVLRDWLLTAEGVYFSEYESWREPFETESKTGDLLDLDGKPLSFASLLATKGCGRMSVIMFGLIFTYLRLKDTMEPAQKEDFARPGKRK